MVHNTRKALYSAKVCVVTGHAAVFLLSISKVIIWPISQPILIVSTWIFGDLIYFIFIDYFAYKPYEKCSRTRAVVNVRIGYTIRIEVQWRYILAFTASIAKRIFVTANIRSHDYYSQLSSILDTCAALYCWQTDSGMVKRQLRLS